MVSTCCPLCRFGPLLNFFPSLLATLIKQDGREETPSLVYDATHNVLSFTHDAHRNPTKEHDVVRFFLFFFLYPFRLNYDPHSISTFPTRRFICKILGSYPRGYEHFFLGQLFLLHCPSRDHELDFGLSSYHAFPTFYHAYVTYGQETFGRLIDSFVTRTVDVFLLPFPLSPFIVTYDIEHLAPLPGLDSNDQP